MSSSNLVRWGGPVAVLGGALFIVYAVFNPLVGEIHWAYHILNAPPNALLAVGIVGLYLYLRQRSGPIGWLGQAGFYLCVAVFTLTAIGGLGIIVADLTGAKTLEQTLDIIHPMVLLLIIGSVLFGIATLRTGVLPRGGALLLIIVPLILLVTFFSGVEVQWLFSVLLALFGAAWAWLGYGLFSERGVSTGEPRRVS